MRRAAAGAGLAVATLISGCASIGGFAGAIAGVATGAATTNPAVGIVVGVAVQSATDSVFQKYARDKQTVEQDRIAAIAGSLAVGERRPWAVHHAFLPADARGEVEVLGVIDNPLAACKEVLVSTVEGEADAPVRRSFITQACQQVDGQWRWAGAEPAVGRWGSLQ